ncbi:hypothetical protein LK09_01870 [Microbacterium mangrovi]|uniref:Uncharacterized protein n=2 Tax=Microbacterium mangrovi TaxID=1348253 RepID=A0A0B2ACX5_9MICO|nr:hypothetical protein LK09_01870 [Microbacterium mangrovi]
MLPLNPGCKNIRAEIDVTAMSGATRGAFNLSLRDQATPEGYVELVLDPTHAGLTTSNGRGGSTSPGGSGDTLIPEPGLWTLQIYGTTATVTDPSGNVRVYDLSDAASYLPGSATAHPKRVWLRNTSATSSFSVNSLKVSKIGF